MASTTLRFTWNDCISINCTFLITAPHFCEVKCQVLTQSLPSKLSLVGGRCGCLLGWVAEWNAYISKVFVSNHPLTFVYYTWVCMCVCIYIYMNFHRCSPLLKLLLGWWEVRVFWNIYIYIFQNTRTYHQPKSSFCRGLHLSKFIK